MPVIHLKPKIKSIQICCTIRTMFLQDVTVPLQVQNRSLCGPHKLGREKSRFQTSTTDTRPCETTEPNAQDVLSPPSSTRRSGSKALKSCTIQSNVAGNASGHLDGYHQQLRTKCHFAVPTGSKDIKSNSNKQAPNIPQP